MSDFDLRDMTEVLLSFCSSSLGRLKRNKSGMVATNWRVPVHMKLFVIPICDERNE